MYVYLWYMYMKYMHVKKCSMLVYVGMYVGDVRTLRMPITAVFLT